MNYTAKDIVSLSAGRAFREKIGMYLSADRQEAINLGLRELIVNVQDEYEVYKPKNPLLKIELNSKTHIIKVTDNMRGIPVGIREDGINSLTAAFLIPHSGGKHTEGVYSSAVGINGEGNKVVCHTAEWLEVEVHRDGNKYFQRFESTDEGATAIEDVKNIGSCEDTGTIITYLPDKKVYNNYFIDYDSLRKMLQEISMFTIGLKIELIIDNKSEIFLSKNGLIDGLQNTNALSKPFSYFYETDDCKVELALQWVSKKGEIRGYANGLYMPDGGAFITGFKQSLTKSFNNLSKSKYDGDSIRNVLDGFVSVKVKVGQFSNQAKTALANPEARTATSTAITNALKDFSIRRKNDFEKVIELLNKVEKAEKAAEKARQAVLDTVKDVEKARRTNDIDVKKLAEAEILGEDSILLCVEGKSAASNVRKARDPKRYGVLQLRGKCINALSNSLEDVLKNEEVILLLKATGINIKDYNNSKLRYGKVGICVDADDDGRHIACLITALFYVLAPQFLKENRLVWLHAPLYKVTKGNKKYYYYTEEELAKGVKGEQIHFKGLGEMDDLTDNKVMFDPATQRLETLTWSDELPMVIEALMGKDSEPKKEFVFNRIDFEKYGEF